jgi:hypothetical protein
MQPILGNYYEIETTLGNRITLAYSQDPSTGDFYGSISPSNYETKGDNVSIGFSEAVRKATIQEITDWNEWYSTDDSDKPLL